MFQIHPPSNRCSLAGSRGLPLGKRQCTPWVCCQGQPILLAPECTSMDCGRKLEYLEGTHADTRTCKLRTTKLLKLLFKKYEHWQVSFPQSSMIPWLQSAATAVQLQIISKLVLNHLKDPKWHILTVHPGFCSLALNSKVSWIENPPSRSTFTTKAKRMTKNSCISFVVAHGLKHRFT